MKRIIKRWTRPLIKTSVFAGLNKYRKFIKDWRNYKKMPHAEPIVLKDTYPCLFDNVSTFSPGSHYFYQAVWAFEKIYNSRVPLHIDIGSKAEFVSLLTAITRVQFVDIRPLDAPYLKNFESIEGSVLKMPYDDNSLSSVSCLHVIEHIGLGRYGDELDPLGTKKAAVELTRCLAKGGNLYVSVPVGKPKLCFNAHRIHSPSQILEYFSGLALHEFSVYDDKKRFMENADYKEFEDSKFACGMFWLTKK